jgi:hypothetical protein
MVGATTIGSATEDVADVGGDSYAGVVASSA